METEDILFIIFMIFWNLEVLSGASYAVTLKGPYNKKYVRRGYIALIATAVVILSILGALLYQGPIFFWIFIFGFMLQIWGRFTPRGHPVWLKKLFTRSEKS